ncbi:S-fimbrillin [Leminorella richardii]|uniref:S-fimbrillin n=1 Tax=Leminorella richardii TaxID=158841 RepID=A0A2X4UMT8_9GAMM|nr:fimbrial protein [Leminorella richardii]SQI40041.1 S-fimbrillin [Leminorella richardii]
MKLKNVVLSAAIVAAFGAATAQAASNGTVNFTGEVIDKTCDITIDGAASPATVILAAVDKSQLAVAGATAKRTGFNIELKNCSGGATVSKAAAFFENGSTVDAIGYRLNNTAAAGTAATQVQLQLVDAATGNPIKVGSPTQHTATTTYDLSSGSATLPYAVEYYATGAATPGLVASSVNFTVNYF